MRSPVSASAVQYLTPRPTDLQLMHWWRALHTDVAATDDEVQREAGRRGWDERLLDLTWSLMDADPHRLTMKQLGRRLACTPGGLTKIVDRAERADVVRRCGSLRDRRVIEIELTAGGEESFRRVVGEQAARIRRHLEGRQRSVHRIA